MKTPEQMADEYGASPHEKDAFLAGYKAAQEHAHAALEEAEAKMQELQDQLADADKVMNSLNNSDGWISVKDRLPDSTPMVLAMCIDGYELAYYGNYGKGQWTNTLGTEHLNVTHWQPLPEPPKEEE